MDEWKMSDKSFNDEIRRAVKCYDDFDKCDSYGCGGVRITAESLKALRQAAQVYLMEEDKPKSRTAEEAYKMASDLYRAGASPETWDFFAEFNNVLLALAGE